VSSLLLNSRQDAYRAVIILRITQYEE